MVSNNKPNEVESHKVANVFIYCQFENINQKNN